MSVVRSVEELEALYGNPQPTATVKEVARITPEYAALIAASPFAVLATVGPEGVDASPRGDAPGFVRIHDETTLMLPDRRGNNRVDSLRNIVRDPRCALLFLIPGAGTTLRVNGRALLDTDEALRERFAVAGQAPRSVLVMQVEAVYFQCARAILRSKLWQAEAQVDPATLPSPGRILAALSAGEIGGQSYDDEWPARARKSMW